jgi:hypothetical protein
MHWERVLSRRLGQREEFAEQVGHAAAHLITYDCELADVVKALIAKEDPRPLLRRSSSPANASAIYYLLIAAANGAHALRNPSSVQDMAEVASFVRFLKQPFVSIAAHAQHGEGLLTTIGRRWPNASFSSP